MRDGRDVLQQGQRLIDRELEHVGDGLASIVNVERLPVVPPPLAFLARHVHVGQEVHLDADDAVALARFAAPALDVEREAARLEPSLPGLGQHRKQLADEREQARVGGRVAAWGAPDGRLVDLDHLVDQIDAVDAIVETRVARRLVERLGERLVQNLVDQRRLARAADAGDRREQAQRDGHVHVLHVVGPRPADHDLSLAGFAAGRRGLDGPLAAQIRAGHRRRVAQQLRGRALEDDLSAVLAGARPQVHDVVGLADGLFVVLDDDHGVAQISQATQRGQQRAVVALMQTNRRLVKHVQDTGEIRTNLCCQTDALRFPARQRVRAAADAEIADADVVQEPQAVVNLLQDASGDDRLAVGELQRPEHLHGFRDGQVHVLGQPPALHPHGAAFRLQPIALAAGARSQRPELFQFLLRRPRRLGVPASQVRDQALEVLAERIGGRPLLP